MVVLFKDCGTIYRLRSPHTSVTEKGNAPECDAKMLTGMTQKLLFHLVSNQGSLGTPTSLAFSNLRNRRPLPEI